MPSLSRSPVAAPRVRPTPAARLDNIDALRAVAVLAVLLFHYTARFPLDYVSFGHPVLRVTSGLIGVDLFFIISGYCILMTATRCPNVGVFWARRMSRLQPAYMAAIVVTFATVATFGLPGRAVNAFQAIENMLWLNGVHLAPHVDGAYWSLIVEVKFYVLFGIVFFALKSRGDVVLLWAVACGAGALVAYIDRFMLGGSIDDRSLGLATFVFPYSAFFLMGMLIYRWDATRRWTKLLALAVFVSCCWYLGRSWAETLALIALFPLAKVVLDRKSLSIPAPLVFIGFVSYPLYLIHQNVGVVVLRQTARVIPSEYGRIALATAVTIALATVISVTVEHRFRKPLERSLERIIRAVLRLPARVGLSQPASLSALRERPSSHPDAL